MCLLLPVVAGVPEPPKTNSSAPVASGNLSASPFVFNGMVESDFGQGSGVVAGHPKVFFTAAHVLFETEMFGWSSPPYWHGGGNSTPLPPEIVSEPSRGFFRWSSYSGHALASGQDSYPAFSNDIALAWGLKPFINGEPASIEFNGYKKLKKHANPSRITGFPAFLDYEQLETTGQMYSTAEEITVFKEDAERYLHATHLSTGPGNSGGPVWLGEDEGDWEAAGLLISGRPSEAGIYGFTPSIKSLLKATSPLVGDVRKSINNSTRSVTTNVGRYVLAKPKKIPDGVHKWTKIPFKVQRFEPNTTVSVVTLDLTITTEHVGDLMVAVMSPTGHIAMVHDGEGAWDDNLVLDNFRVEFDDDDWGDVQAMPNGTWALLVQDRLTGDICTVTRLELEISTDDSIDRGGEQP